jgi:hypothetical protein
METVGAVGTSDIDALAVTAELAALEAVAMTV